MHKITRAEAESIREAMKATKKNVRAYKRLQAVALRGEGKKRREISEITGYHPRTIGHLCKLYSEKGIEGLIADGRKGGNHRNMTDEEAKAFLNGFAEAASKGQIITIDEIAKAYDEAVGVEHKSLSTVYYLLHKLGWRKVLPKKFHPGKAKEEVIEASKKLTLS